MARYRYATYLRFYAAESQRHQAGVAQQAAVAQTQLAATLPDPFGRVPGKSAANRRKWAANRFALHKFQGSIPADELARFEPPKPIEPPAAGESCKAALAQIAGQGDPDRECAGIPGS